MNVLRYLIKALGVQGLAVVLLGLLSGVTNAAAVAWFGRLLADHQSPSSNSLLWLGGCLVVAVLSDLVAKSWFIRLTAAASSNLRREFARQILQRPFDQLERVGSARLLTALTDDVSKIGQSLGNLPTVLIAVVTVSGCFLYLAYLSPGLMAVSLAIGLPVTWSCLTLHRRAGHHIRAAMGARDSAFDHFRSLIEGIKELKLNTARRQAFVDDLLEPQLIDIQKQAGAARLWYQLAVTGSQVSVFVVILGLLASVKWLAVDAAVLTTFAVVLLYVKTAIQAVLNWLPTYSEARAAIANLEDVGLSLSAQRLIHPDASASVRRTHHVQLAMTGVSYRYATDTAVVGNEPFALGPLDLTLQSGEVIFVVGDNGCGKTTLMKLLIGLYVPTAGSICLNGEAISDENRERYRQQFSVVFADFFLFEQLLGLDADDLPALAREYLEQLELADRVVVSCDGLSTTRLSHGQRQRLALLTAYLEDRPIYVFDEWAANQDPKFRDVFYRRILPELKARGKLIVVISHDDRYFDMADRVIHLTGGLVATPPLLKDVA